MMGMPFNKKKISNERDLLEHLGFEVTISYQADVREIIGLAGDANKLNLFKHVFESWKQSAEHWMEQYQDRLRATKAMYPIEKDFLIGHQSMWKAQLGDIIDNTSLAPWFPSLFSEMITRT
jgi:hypothetical protein